MNQKELKDALPFILPDEAYENEQFSREQSFHLQKYGKQKHHTLEEAATKYAALMPLLEELAECETSYDAANLTTQIKEIMEKE